MGGPRRYRLTMWAVRQGVRLAPSGPGIPANWGIGPAAATFPRSPAPRSADGGGRKKETHPARSKRRHMSSREAILQRIRSRLAGTPAPVIGARRSPAESGPEGRLPTGGVLADQFTDGASGGPRRADPLALDGRGRATPGPAGWRHAPWPSIGAVESPDGERTRGRSADRPR